LNLLLVIAICALLVGFAFFTRDYHGQQYRSKANAEFFNGLLPALDFARQEGDQPICVTKDVNMPYIYVLFSEKMNPRDYRHHIDYIEPRGRFREVRSLGRYTFGVQNCPNDVRTIYVLAGERPPGDIHYKINNFGNFHVYSP
jgi:hypothetical protein